MERDRDKCITSHPNGNFTLAAKGQIQLSHSIDKDDPHLEITYLLPQLTVQPIKSSSRFYY